MSLKDPVKRECIFCFEDFKTFKELCDHSASCPDHPLFQENKRLREALLEIHKFDPYERNKYCDHPHGGACQCVKDIANEALSRPEGTPRPTTRDKE